MPDGSSRHESYHGSIMCQPGPICRPDSRSCLFGNGRIAVKASLGRYNEHGTYVIPTANAPASTIVTTATRTWNDSFHGTGDPRSGNYQPDCDLSLTFAKGECGPLGANTFGQPVAITCYSPELLDGFGKRPYNWQTSVAFRQELRPGAAITASRYRTSWDNFRATDNLLVTPADFDPYCVTAPTHAGLPGGGGFGICALYDLSPSKFGAADNLVVPRKGDADVYNGLEVALNMRFGQRDHVMGGVSTGRHVIDNCTVVDSRQTFQCRTVNSWQGQTRYKVSVVYPWRWGLTPAIISQNLPGTQILANRAFTNAEIAPSLGRNLSDCPAPTGPCSATVTVQLIEPYTQFEERLSQIDLRRAKGLTLGTARMQVIFDNYNLFNATTVLARNNTVGATWGRPTSILGARLLEVGLQVNF